jgi:hypothetical protein
VWVRKDTGKIIKELRAHNMFERTLKNLARIARKADSFTGLATNSKQLRAKHLGVGFNFAGKGIDTRTTGVVLIPACVIIILQLRLVKMGTPAVKLVILETD